MISCSLTKSVTSHRFLQRFLAVVLVSLPAIISAPFACGTDTPVYASSSRLSSGRWVKIRLRDTGMHQITAAELRAMGFSNPERVAVFGFGAVELSDYAITPDTPDDLPAVPSIYENGKLIFYGMGDTRCSLSKTEGDVVTTAVMRNLYADYGAYFLTDSALPVAPAESNVPVEKADADAVEMAYGMVHIEEEIENPTAFGPFFFGESFVTTPCQTYGFRMPGMIGSEPVGFLMESVFLVAFGSKLKIESPSGAKRTMNIYGSDPAAYKYVGHSAVWTDRIQANASGDYHVVLDASEIPELDYGAFDYLTVAYPRSTEFDTSEGTQQMYVFDRLAKEKGVAFRTMSAGDVRLWDVTDPLSPLILSARESFGDGGSRRLLVASPSDYSLEEGREAYFVVFDPSADLLPVEPMGEVAHSNLHSLASPAMVIIAARNFMGEAERLAEAHRRIDGLDVAVVCQDEVYNEFSSGTPHVSGLRRFVKMLYDRDPSVFRSVLLFGSASLDNRDKANGERQSFRDIHIPIIQQENKTFSGHCSRSFASDSYVGMTATQQKGEPFSLYTNQMEVNVSRIPADNAGDAAAVVDKTIRFMENPAHPVASNAAMLWCDKGDALEHMKDMEEISKIIGTQAPSTVVYKGYDPFYPQHNGNADQLHRYYANNFARGVSYWAYSGHSTPFALGGEPIWNINYIQSTDYEIAPFAVFATCRALYFDHAGNSLGEAALYQPRGGAITVIGALREVYKDKNLLLHKSIANEYFSASDGTTAGDVFRRARRNSVSTPSSQTDDFIINTLSFNMIGDPEVKICRPQMKVVLTTVDGKPFDADKPLAVGAGKPVRFEGRIEDASGKVAAGFDGSLTFSLFDGTRVAKVINVGSGSGEAKWKDYELEMNDEIIFEKVTDVKGGRFAFTAAMPSPIRPGSENRMTFAAATPDAVQQATGSVGNITVIPSETGYEISDAGVPEITDMYVVSPSFADGDLVSGDLDFHASVAPNDPGVAGSSALPGQSMRLVLDGSRSFTEASMVFVPDARGGGTIDLPLADIEDGPHYLTLRVRNYAGQTAERTIHFTTVSVCSDATIEVEEYPARERATINLSVPYADPATGRIVIRNGMGEVVFTNENTAFPFEWNLCDNDGKPLPDGFYTAEVYYSSGLRHGFAGPATIVVYRGREK